MNTVVSFVAFLLIVVQIQAASIDEDFELKNWYNEPVTNFVANGTISEHISYMVSIRHRSVESDGFGFGHLCGGVLITRSHILTLGSCISRITNDDRRIVWRPDQLILALGSRYRYDAVNTTFVTPREIRIHPQYSFDGLLNNVALIILRDPLIEMARVNPISISNSNIPLGSSCDIMGWGTVFSGNGSRELMTGRVNVVDISLCNNVPNRICAGPDYIRGCPGDDGGPLVCNNVVYGLIDFKNGNHCELDSQGRYEYYIRIADYHTWIMQVISTLTPTPTTTTPKDDDGGAAQIATSVLLITLTVILSVFVN